MSGHLHARILAIALIVIGFGAAIYQNLVLKVPLTPDARAPVWFVDARIDLPVESPTSVNLNFFVPTKLQDKRFVQENFISRNFGTAVDDKDNNRVAKITRRTVSSNQTIFYRLKVIGRNQGGKTSRPPKRWDWTQPVALEPDLEGAAKEILVDIRDQSPDFQSLISRIIHKLNDEQHPNATMFLDSHESRASKARATIVLASQMYIPVELVHGLRLEDGQYSELDVWLRSYNGDTWLYFDPETGREGLPDNVLEWYYGDEPVLTGHRILPKSRQTLNNLGIEFGVSTHDMDALAAANKSAKSSGLGLWSLSLYELPASTQNTYRIMMVIPLGALIVLLMRNVIGIETVGTFMPVLIALAFRETQLLWGIVLFASVTGMGLLLRAYLEKLKLQLLPRLGIMLTLVVLSMALISVLSYKLGLPKGLSVALFPIVILTMTIERMSIMWEERGASTALRAAVGSLFIATLSYLVMFNNQVEHLMFTFPSLALAVVGLMLTVGFYRGYRLKELLRFSAMVEDRK